MAWKAPQEITREDCDRMADDYHRELQILLDALPDRFSPIVRAVLRALPGILALPMVVLHMDFGDCNIIVEEESCHLAGVVDWAEAEIAPFGTNLHSLQNQMSELNLSKGYIRCNNYQHLWCLFWDTLGDEVGGLSDDTVRFIKAAMVLGLLRSRGFTSRRANATEPVPIKDDDSGRYDMMILDGLLISPATRFDGIDELVDGLR